MRTYPPRLPNESTEAYAERLQRQTELDMAELHRMRGKHLVLCAVIGLLIFFLLMALGILS